MVSVGEFSSWQSNKSSELKEKEYYKKLAFFNDIFLRHNYENCVSNFFNFNKKKLSKNSYVSAKSNIDALLLSISSVQHGRKLRNTSDMVLQYCQRSDPTIFKRVGGFRTHD